MKTIALYVTVIAASLGVYAVSARTLSATPLWCWPYGGQGRVVTQVPHLPGTEYVTFGSYGADADPNNPDHTIPLNYWQDDGKRVYMEQCIWCHADSTPAGPSNRSNVTPTPPRLDDGTIFNAWKDTKLERAIALGGLATGKSAMMPPYGQSLTPQEVADVVAYMRVIATPAYKKPTLWSRIASLHKTKKPAPAAASSSDGSGDSSGTGSDAGSGASGGTSSGN